MESPKLLGSSAARRQSVALNQMSFRRREAAASGTIAASKSTSSNSTPASPVSGSKASSFKNAAKKVKLGVHIAALAKTATEQKASAEETTDESSLSLPRKKLKELKKIEKRRKNSVNVLIMDSVTRNFSLSKSTLGRLRPAIKCADTFILGMKYIVSPILLPVYIVYAFMNPSVKDAKVDVLGAHNIGSENNDTNDRKLRIQSEIPGGKLRRQYTIDCDEEKIIRTSNDAPVNSSSTKDQGMRFAVNTTKAAPEQSSFSSSSVQSSDMTQLGMRGPTNVYVSKNRKEKTSTRIQIDELAGEASSGMGRDNKFVGSTTQLIDGPALSDLSPYRYQAI